MSKVITIFIDDILRDFSGAFKACYDEQYPNNTFSNLDIFNLNNFFESSNVFNEFFNSNFFTIISASETKYQGCINDFSNVKHVLNSEGYKIRLVSRVTDNRQIFANYFFLSKNFVSAEEVIMLSPNEDILTKYNQEWVITTDYRIQGDNVILLEAEYNKEYLGNYKHTIKKVIDIPKIIFKELNSKPIETV
jgi:hypothetical protein